MRAFALLLLATFGAHAQTCPPPIADPVPVDAVRLTWIAPSTNSDGSLIKPPITYNVYQSDGKGGAFKACQVVAAPGASLTMLAPPGPIGWVVTASTVDGDSVASNVAIKTIQAATTPPPPPPPPPAQTLRVDPAALTAYKLVQTTANKLTLGSIGTVTVGTACDVTQPVLGKYVVPRTAVTLVGTTTRPNVVVAQCKLQ